MNPRETEAQEGDTTYPRSPSQQVPTLGLNPGDPGSLTSTFLIMFFLWGYFLLPEPQFGSLHFPLPGSGTP